MTCASSDEYFEWSDQIPISFGQWKSILSKLTKEETTKQLRSSSNPHPRSTSRQYSSSPKKQERQALSRNQVFNDTTIDSFLVSSPSNIAQSSLDIPKLISSPSKRYVSSFKTLVNSTSGKNSQRLSYVNDSVIILKLSKENATENTCVNSQVSSKRSTISMATSTTTPPRQSSPSPSRLSPVLKVEGQKCRTVPNDSALIPAPNIDQSTPLTSAHTMATSTTSHPSSNPSLFAYRCTITGGNTVRQRALTETNTNSLFITTERLKSNISSSMRPARQPLTTTATMSSAYMTAQQPQRNTNQNTRPRIQQDKLTNSKDLYEYPDPFTNCPQDILSKLAQLTKLQLETVEWEKKRRFTKKKIVSNGTTHGKDSP